MNGRIYTDVKCPICGSTLKSVEPAGMVCRKCPGPKDWPQKLYKGRCRIVFDNKSYWFDTYQQAHKKLSHMRVEKEDGTFDPRDYLTRDKPLSFNKLSDEWLNLKSGQIKPASWRSLAAGIRKAQVVWGEISIKSLQYAHLEDFFAAYPGAPKSKANAMAALKQFFAWVHDRYDIPEVKKWPKLGYVEMAFRDTVDLETQEAIINDIQAHEPFRVWLCIKWLATYIAIRPGEMRSLTEGQVDRQRGVLIIPHPKERRAKVIPLIADDIEIVNRLPLAFDQSMPFFRHEADGKLCGKAFGHDQLYRAWRRACGRLGVSGVPIYPGTKHSTAMGLRAIYTPEQIKAQTLHSTSAAFNRYFQTGGEDLRSLFEGRNSLVGNCKLLARKKG